MKSLLLMALLAPAFLLAATPAQPLNPSPSQPLSGKPVRNPFWPIGYEGKRESITGEVRVAPKNAEESRQERGAEDIRVAAAKARAEAAERERIVKEGQWTEAYKALRIGGRVKAYLQGGGEVSSVVINDKTYGDGDLISFTHGKNRFTWRVKGLSDGKTVRLDRVGARHFEEPAEADYDNSANLDNSAKGVGK